LSTLTKLSKSPPADYHSWDQSEFSNGEIIDLQASLGKPCKNLVVYCEGGEGIVKLNVVRKIYKNQESAGNKFIPDAAFWRCPILVGEVEVSTDSITITADTAWSWNQEFALLDIKIVTKAPLMRIVAS
jgi:hypothetical protein